jgi:hypothetical protein
MKKNIKATRQRKRVFIRNPEIEKKIRDEIKKAMEKAAKNWIL